MGGVHKWIDIGLIENSSMISAVFLCFYWSVADGCVAVAAVSKCLFLGKKEHDKIPDFISNSSVCLIPYLLTEYTKMFIRLN